MGMMKALRIYSFCSVLFALTCFFSINTQAATWYVPDDFPTIQGAIGSASVVNNDTVIVRSNTYYENINFLGKEITLRSQNGAQSTIIDGTQSSSVVTFNSNVSAHPTLDGFTIRNGIASSGGGIYCCNHVYPHINNCVIKDNSCVNNGGGIYCATETAPTLINCIISENTANYGGGIYCTSYVSADLTNCIISGNKGAASGGALYCSYYSFTTFLSCTISDNSTNKNGGGICAKTFSTVSIINSILWENKAGAGTDEIYTSQSIVDVSYSDVQGGWPGTGNINSLPIFVDSANNDFHLTYQSPCRNIGDSSAIGLQTIDFEGDLRIAYGAVDMGADEFHRHLYCTGDMAPGGNVQVNLVGDQGLVVWLFISPAKLNPPLPSAYGDWYLAWPFIGPIITTIPQSGVCQIPFIIPANFPAPLNVYLQSFVGSYLTNLSVMGIK